MTFFFILVSGVFFFNINQIIPNPFKAFREQVCLLIFYRKSELAEKIILGQYFASHALGIFDVFLTTLKVTVLSL